MTFIGKTWRGIRRFVQDARIDADFHRYETEQRVMYESTATRRFDTSQLECEIADIRRSAELEGCAVYGARIRDVEASIHAVQPTIKELRTRLELLTRDYRHELEVLYEERTRLLAAKQALIDQMKALQEERSEAHVELDEAHAELRKAKAAIDGWYAKSDRPPWLFGNGGKRLPNRSLFGQSFGDLDGYNADRARACEEIGACKAAVADVVGKQGANKSHRDDNKNNLNQIVVSINAVKAARQQMFDLKDQGVRRHRVEEELSDLLREDASFHDDVNHLTSAMAELVRQQASRLGIEERRRAASELREKCSLFLAAFDAPEQRAARRQAHREWWLAGRAVA